MNRRVDIDMAKGLAILLVVFGHLVARADPANVFWYEPLRRAVYSFHMPFFLFLSGLVASLSGAVFAPPAAWPGLAKRRAIRLLVPFFLLGVLINVCKMFAAHFMTVDNQPSSLANGLASLIWHTADSPALSIWYLFVLFVLSLTCPLILRGRRERLFWLVAIAAVLYLVPLPPYIYADRTGRYAIFFVLGLCAGANDAEWTRLTDNFWPTALFILLSGCVLIALFGGTWPPALILLPMGIISMPALLGLVRHLPSRILLQLGRYSFIIYLLNTLCIGLAKGVLLHFLSWNGDHFLLFVVVLMAAGVLVPIALKRIIPTGSTFDRLTN